MNKLIAIICLLIPGYLFAGINFDGTDDYIDLGTMDVSGSAITISCWIYIDDFDNTDQRIISKANGPNEGDHWWMISTIGGPPYNFRFRLKTGSTTTTLAASTDDVATGAWINIIAWYDGSNMKLYRNGTEIATTAKTGTLAEDNSVHADIGRAPNATNYFDGTITNVAIWNTALNAAEIARLNSHLKLSPIDIRPDYLVMFLPLDEVEIGVSADGSAFYDWSANNHNGTGDDGANNTGLTGTGEILTYPQE